MHVHLAPEQRLDLLRQADTIRKWNSLDDKRHCIMCQRVFTGRQVDIQRDQRGRYLFKCPTEDCPSFIAHWFHVGSAPRAAVKILRNVRAHYFFGRRAVA
jgi:hypothetical protein